MTGSSGDMPASGHPRRQRRIRILPPRGSRWRRRLLILLATVVAVILVPTVAWVGVFAYAYQTAARSNLGEQSFDRPLVIPPLAKPTVDEPGRKRFDLTLRTGTSELVEGVQTPTWGANGAYLAPTLRARRGDAVTVNVTNQLPEATTTIHWHGMRLPAVADGGPHQPIQPGQTWSPSWTVINPAATLWYHPHLHESTAEHVYRGIAGMFIIDDAEAGELTLPQTYGVDDVPLILQDKKLNGDGSLNFEPGSALTQMAGVDTVGVVGDEMLVNGTANAHLEVTAQRTRLRLLNAAGGRVFNLGFPDGRSFDLIATEQGLLEAPVELERLQLGPGERAEIVVELAAGERVNLRSFSPELGTSFPMHRFAGGDDTFDLLQLRAAASLTTSPPLPERLGGAPATPEEPPADAAVRQVKLTGKSTINGQSMELSRLDEVVPAGATEIWEVTSTSHPHVFHVHGVSFRVLDIGGQPPPANLRGRKDAIFLPERVLVRLAVTFDPYTDPDSPYMFHCHILSHEDRGMMGQFVVVEPGAEDDTPRQIQVPPGAHAHGPRS